MAEKTKAHIFSCASGRFRLSGRTQEKRDILSKSPRNSLLFKGFRGLSGIKKEINEPVLNYAREHRLR